MRGLVFGMTLVVNISPPSNPAPDDVMVEMQGICKSFPGVVANDNVDLEVARGNVHAILGENGAGKSTLMHILSGLYRPTAGDIWVEGVLRHFSAPLDAIEAGIGMVHQHFMLAETLTVAENVILGDRSLGLRITPTQIQETVAALAAETGMDVDPDAYIWQLSVGEQQRVEIIKMLYRGARLLILDEPTAVLVPQERTQLFRQVRRMAMAGHTILFISHKLDEVMTLADMVTVMRAGKVVATVPTQETSQEELVRMMVGRPVLFDFEKVPVDIGDTCLRLENLQVRNERGAVAVKGVSLEVRAGEILGIAGVAGNGQRELAEAITGLRPASQGKVEVEGLDTTHSTTREIIDAGVAYVPPDRQRTGTAPNLTLIQNLALKDYRTAQPGQFMSRSQQAQRAADLIEKYDVIAASPEMPARLLSGGNLQKLILARELSAPIRVLIASSPTRGLDIGAIESVQKTLLAQKAQGLAILLISEDLDEILALSDRVAVMYEGELRGPLDAAGIDVEAVGLMMAGSSDNLQSP